MSTEKTNERTPYIPTMGTLASLSGSFFPKPEVVIGRLKGWGYEIVSQQVEGDVVHINFRKSEKLRNTPLDQIGPMIVEDEPRGTYSVSEPKPRFRFESGKPEGEFVDKSSYYIGDDGREYATSAQLREANRRWAESQRLPEKKPYFPEDNKINLNLILNKQNVDYIKPRHLDFEPEKKDDWKFLNHSGRDDLK